MLRLNTDNVINGSCFDKEPFELYFNKVFYTENNNKINEIKDDVYSSFKENLKAVFHSAKNPDKTSFSDQKFLLGVFSSFSIWDADYI